MREAMLHGGHARVIETVEITAACFFFATAAARIVPGFHSDTYHLVSFIMKHEGGNGTVYTTTHRHQYFTLTTHNLNLNKLQIYESTFCHKGTKAGRYTKSFSCYFLTSWQKRFN